MNAHCASALNILSLTIAFVCFGLCLALAVIAFSSSREVGGGVAQGDLGFFMVLTVVTPIVLCAVVLLSWKSIKASAA
jgi:hypothetical protein